jgi:hypothetical protein
MHPLRMCLQSSGIVLEILLAGARPAPAGGRPLRHAHYSTEAALQTAGPCPPCPRIVHASCYCGSVSSERRCGRHEFSCGGVCGQRLSCGHTCPEICHEVGGFVLWGAWWDGDPC